MILNENFKNLTKQQIAKIANLIKSRENSQPAIICIGLLNAGKSSLLNALVGDIENATFATSDIRETKKNKILIANGVTYIDTPGLDATTEDTKHVYDVIVKADIILFAHNINSGELDPTEINFLKDITQDWEDAKTFLENTIFVLTRKDELGIEKENIAILEVTNKIKHQVQEIFKSQPVIIALSSETYVAAIKSNETLLMKDSNFTELKRYIEKYIKNNRKLMYKNKGYRIEAGISELTSIVMEHRQGLFEEKIKLINESEQSVFLLKQDLKKFNEILKEKENIYKGL